jgi:hypothetical protein
MNIHTATEVSYKNGYKQALLDVLELHDKGQYTTDQIVAMLSPKVGEGLFNGTSNLETEM